MLANTITTSTTSGSSPTITVILPVYNGEQFLSAAISGLQKQTFTDFELIVIDDGSIDNTAEIITSFSTFDPRIKLVSEPHLGITKSLNTGLKLAQGRFIARQDADDISHPDRLSIQLSWLQNYQYDLCCSRAFSIRKNRAIPRRWLIALPRKVLNP